MKMPTLSAFVEARPQQSEQYREWRIFITNCWKGPVEVGAVKQVARGGDYFAYGYDGTHLGCFDDTVAATTAIIAPVLKAGLDALQAKLDAADARTDALVKKTFA